MHITLLIGAPGADPEAAQPAGPAGRRVGRAEEGSPTYDIISYR